MAKVIIHLKEPEHSALHELAQREYRTLPAQAAIIIHQQLQTIGLLPENETGDDGMLSSSIRKYPAET